MKETPRDQTQPRPATPADSGQPNTSQPREIGGPKGPEPTRYGGVPIFETLIRPSQAAQGPTPHPPPVRDPPPKDRPLALSRHSLAPPSDRL
jgi:hypothetical protein